jgi:hypothetical protein
MSLKKTRVCLWLTYIIYAVGLFLPISVGEFSPVLAALPLNCWCGLFGFPSTPDDPPGLRVFSFVALQLAHPVFWTSWLAYVRRSPMWAAAASGLAALLWLVPLWIGRALLFHSSERVGGLGYWCCFATMAATCLFSLLNCKALWAEEQEARAAARAIVAVDVAAFGEWLDDQANHSRHE